MQPGGQRLRGGGKGRGWGLGVRGVEDHGCRTVCSLGGRGGGGGKGVGVRGKGS